MRPLFTMGLEGEPISWELVSQSNSNGMVKSVFEAYSEKYDKIYHLVDLSGKQIAVSQHLSFR